MGTDKIGLVVSHKSMAQAKLLDPDKSYTFRSYFEMPYDTSCD